MSGETKGVTNPLKAYDWMSHTWEETLIRIPCSSWQVANLSSRIPFLYLSRGMRLTTCPSSWNRMPKDTSQVGCQETFKPTNSQGSFISDHNTIDRRDKGHETLTLVRLPHSPS